MGNFAGRPMLHVTADELALYHRAKGVTNTSCERCGKLEWAILSSEEVPAAAIPSASDDIVANVHLFFPVLSMICKNCGNVWLQAYQPVREWLDSRPTLRSPD